MTDGPVIIYIPIQKVVQRINGANVEGFEFQGLWRIEYSDGETHFVTSPVDQFIWGQGEAATASPVVMFKFESGTNNPPSDNEGFPINAAI